MTVSVIVPCFNEERRLPRTFAGIDALPPVVTEVIVVDDGSADRTAALARELAASRPHVQVVAAPHRGKGGAVRAGVLASHGEWVCFADADWSVAPTDLLEFLPPRAPAADILVATREGLGAERRGEPWPRHVAGRVFNALVRRTALSGLQDTQCGFKMFRGDVARSLFVDLATGGWAFDVEVLCRAHARGYRIREVPVAWTYDPDSRVRPGDAFRMAWDVAGVALRHRRS